MDIDEYGFEVHFFLCQCSHPEHTLRIDYEKDPNFLTFEIFLARLPWYKRIWHGIKYICGFKSKYGDFTSIIFHPKDADRMISILRRCKKRATQIKEECKRWDDNEIQPPITSKI